MLVSPFRIAHPSVDDYKTEGASGEEGGKLDSLNLEVHADDENIEIILIHHSFPTRLLSLPSRFSILTCLAINLSASKRTSPSGLPSWMPKSKAGYVARRLCNGCLPFSRIPRHSHVQLSLRQ